MKITNQIDSMISIKIPDQEKEPLLYEMVKNFIVYGPCGEVNFKSP